MSLLRILRHDINDGIIKNWYKWLLCIIAFVLMCYNCYRITYGFSMGIFFDVNTEIIHMWIMKGRWPYHYDPNFRETFTVPFEWIFLYVMLAFIIGNYIRQDMEGYGRLMMVQAGSRRTWWLSKTIWVVIVNVLFWGMLWITEIIFCYFKCTVVDNQSVKYFIREYFRDIYDKTDKMYLIVLFLLPVLVGIVQSILQIIVSIIANGELSFAVVSILLIVSSYYSNKFVFHGYSMVQRYCINDRYPDDVVLDEKFGLIYLIILILMLDVAGLKMVSKLNLLENNKD